MTTKLPLIDWELFPSWEKQIQENPELKNSLEMVWKNYEKSLGDLYTGIIFLPSF